MCWSKPTSPGRGDSVGIGRIFFKTKEMIHVVEAPDIVRNDVSLSLLGLVAGEVSLEGNKLGLLFNFVSSSLSVLTLETFLLDLYSGFLPKKYFNILEHVTFSHCKYNVVFMLSFTCI